MADFKDVMRDWKRMCKAHDRCADCPLMHCISPHQSKWLEDHTDVFDEIETTAMKWADEHPEPVYPSWYAWLANMGIVPIELPPDQAVFVTDIGLLKKIPADIAEKLGIEPKEGI